MNLFKTMINDLTPRKKDQFHLFVRAWNGKIYSAATAQLVYIGSGVRLFKHSSGDYFLVWEPMYEDFGYSIYTRDEAIKWLSAEINNKNVNHIMEILKSEFNLDAYGT